MFKLIRGYLRGPAVVCALFAPICMVVEVFMDLQQPTLMAHIIDNGVARGDLNYVLHTGGRMILFALAGLLGGAGCSVLTTFASEPMAGEMRKSLFAKIQTFSFAEIDRLETSSLITRLTNDVSQMQQMLSTMLRSIRGPQLCIGGIVMAFLLSPRMALILCAALPILTCVIVIIVTRAVPLYTKVQRQMDAVNTVMRENLLGVRVVKAFTMESPQFSRFSGVNDALMQDNIHAQKITFLMTPMVTLVMNLGVVAALWFGGNMQITGILGAGKIMAFVNYLVQITGSLGMLVMMVMTFSRASASAVRIQEVLDTGLSIVDPPEPQKPEGCEIVFEKVSFRYPNGAATGEKVLHDLNFTIPPGTKVGIIGGTGGGKSTLVNLIDRLYDVTEGRITIGGVDIRRIPLSSLHQKVGIVLQDSLLFAGTVAENLRYGDESAAEDRLWEAARAAQAGSFLAALPEGLASRVEQRGRNLSGGQKQRLSIARTLLQNPDILILDDSSSALDLATDAQLRSALGEWKRGGPAACGGTLILIAQRVSSLMDCDLILVLDKGRLIAEGRHRELLASCEIYRSIAVSQLGEEALYD
jgi:ATP-binding cassette subfamily B protein